MVSVAEAVDATDDSGDPPSCVITGVTSNENISGDWEITGDLTVDLRAERDGNGDGRVYTITVTCTDGSDNSSDGTVAVTVAHDQGNGNANGRNK